MRHDFAGHGASRGLALGRARVRLPHALEMAEQRVPAAQADAEAQRLHDALEAARAEMRALREKLQGALSKEAFEFIDLHALLLDDPELVQALETLVRQERYSAGYALRVQRDRLAAVFEQMDDPYLRSRLDDLDHIIGRINAHLQRREPLPRGTAGEVLVCDNVAPSELAQLQAQGVVAIVSAAGSPLSHSAILARSLHLPLVVGAAEALARINDGDVVMVDGETGEVVVDPDAADLRRYQQREQQDARARRDLERLRSKPTRTRDGVDIALYANAESREDVARAHALGAAGVGLYRTEFLFLQRNELPDEDEQFQVYRDAVLGMSGRPVTFRTLDLGADKADRTGLSLANEDNPALGVRGVRLSLLYDQVFDTQLRAIARAAAYGPVRVLVPMVSCREEVLLVRRRLRRAVAAVKRRGVVVVTPPLGAMIEVPAAAIGVHGLVDAVDFMSIGTNDLVQYLLAVDRNNDALGDLYSPLHPGVLRLLAHVIGAGAQSGTPVAVCGEMAGDTRLAPLLLAIGLREFSLHPASLLELRRAIRECRLDSLRERAGKLLQARDRSAIERWLQEAVSR
ncbi:phosphoenolpyruvate--protein phosphotransferase [Pseudoxanthomonas kaohsiungensis]|uniref:Phosphoenolpyruvate-protein phosphotransferase n=1 Tax=Pseudoxanthomonas kaohsiungensis TaxID=283923 RepID=A0ABW3LW54_9GAMM|nr:phosphoenolpyruvate--protein phosphotransferase [Pseudoxanthomonas kaohsiungensis]KAF1702170.1 phosphoenolpyruvate--protein phosphotransferase [Pseudoxanthomonas kaohsiungensis]